MKRVFLVAATLLLAATAAFGQADKGGGFGPAAATEACQPYERLWLVSIGVSRYKNPAYKLDFPENDARQIVALFAQRFAVTAERTTLLLDSAATFQGVRNAFAGLQKAVGDNDAVVVYFSGHGKDITLPTGDKRGYLVPYEGDLDNLYGTAIDMDELRRIAQMLRARHVLFLVDACYSGIAGSEKSLQSLPPAGSLGEVARVSRQRARQVLTAGRGNETALELASLGHGAFTYWVLKGLEGSADQNHDCYILASELFAYVQPLVREATNYHQSPQYFLLPDGQDGDFVFALAPCSGAKPLPVLPPEKAAAPGYLVVDTKPWVKIFIDDKYLGESPKCGISLPAGRHQVRLINEPRGVDKSLEVDIRPGETRYVVGAFELR